MECCPKFCRAWLVGRRLTIFTALNSRSVACLCAPSCGHGRRALSVGLLWPLQTVLPLMRSVVAAVGGSASLVAVSGGSHVLAGTYGEYLGSGYSHKLVEYPVFNLRLLKRNLQKVSSSVFGSLDPFAMTELIVTRLKGA